MSAISLFVTMLMFEPFLKHFVSSIEYSSHMVASMTPLLMLSMF